MENKENNEDSEVMDKMIPEAEEVNKYDNDLKTSHHTDETSEEDIQLETEKLPEALDGGYGWVIVLSSALIHCIIGGMERAEGILYLKFIDRFQQSAVATAWVFSLCTAIRLVLGPVASGLSNRFSCRKTVIAGGLVSSLGMFLSGFTKDLIQLNFTYGVVSGIGRCLVYTPALIITGHYFDRRRGLAVGLATSGVGVGTFLIPPAIEFMFEKYTFFGVFLILSALFLNFLVCGAMLRPFSVHKRISELKRKKKEGLLLTEEKLNSQLSDKNNATFTTILTETDNTSANITNVNRKTSSSSFDKDCNHSKSVSKPLNETGDYSKISKKKQKFIELSLLKSPPFCLYCVGIFLYTASFKSGFIFLPALVKSSGISESRAAIMLSIIGVFDTVSRISAGIIFDLPKVKRIRTFIYSGLIFVLGLLSFLCPMLSTFEEFAFLAAAYGIMTGSYVSQKSVIVVDILGIEKLSSSFGLLICFQGFGCLLGPPLSGMIKDIYGRYDEAFYFCGGMLMLSCVITFIGAVCHRISS